MIKLLIVAGTMAQGINKAAELRLERTDFRVVIGVDYIRGHRDIPVIYVGEWYKLPDIGEIREYAETHGLVEVHR